MTNCGSDNGDACDFTQNIQNDIVQQANKTENRLKCGPKFKIML